MTSFEAINFILSYKLNNSDYAQSLAVACKIDYNFRFTPGKIAFSLKNKWGSI